MMDNGLYGASAVRLPIQAPPMPRLNRISGTMQQDEAASAPKMPPTAIRRCRPTSPRSDAEGSAARGATLAVPDRDATLSFSFLVEILRVPYHAVCSRYRVKRDFAL